MASRRHQPRRRRHLRADLRHAAARALCRASITSVVTASSSSSSSSAASSAALRTLLLGPGGSSGRRRSWCAAAPTAPRHGATLRRPCIRRLPCLVAPLPHRHRPRHRGARVAAFYEAAGRCCAARFPLSFFLTLERALRANSRREPNAPQPYVLRCKLGRVHFDFVRALGFSIEVYMLFLVRSFVRRKLPVWQCMIGGETVESSFCAILAYSTHRVTGKYGSDV